MKKSDEKVSLLLTIKIAIKRERPAKKLHCENPILLILFSF